MKKKYHIQPGDKFNRLTCINLDHIGSHYRSYFLFKCVCGNKKIILGSGVVSGNTKSCGCLSKENKAKKRLPNNHSEITAIILQYKRHAKARSIKFSLSRCDVDKIVRMDCYYCGSKPSNLMLTKNSISGFKYNGIDRIDNTKGYSLKNCAPACKICNIAKRNMTIKDFNEWAIKIGAM